MKELAFQIDEERKNQDRLNEMIEQLHQKLTVSKRQVEEAVSMTSYLSIKADLYW